MYVDIIPKDKKIENLLQRLMHHPYQSTSPVISQALSRYKGIRYLNELAPRDNNGRKLHYVGIKKGCVGLRDNVRIVKYKRGYRIEIIS